MDPTGRYDALLARAVLARALARGFRPPTEETLRAFRSDEGKETLLMAARLLAPEGGTEIQAAIAGLPAAPIAVPEVSALASRYNTLFGHTARGRVCPYETEYGGDGLFQQAHALADLSGYYLGFGLMHEASERQDHVACELEFLEFLTLKQMWALEHFDTEMFEVTTAAMRKFVKEHLGRFGLAFALALAREDDGGLHGGFGILCVAFLRVVCGQLSIPVGPDLINLRSAEEDDVPMACGSSCGPCPTDAPGAPDA